jgi:4-hydroxy-4-methyl-2-oxoglutarate aldolase
MELTDEKRSELLQLPCGNIADNNPSGGVMDPGIKPLDPYMKMVGRALPVRCYPGDNLALYQGIEAARPGDVLVFDCGGYAAGHFGDMMAHACMAKGVAGVVIDGTCRDRNDIVELGLPVFTRGLNPAGTVKASLGRVGERLVAGSVAVAPGDIVFGDCDGVVVVPAGEADVVFAAALAKHHKEEMIAERLDAGESALAVYGFDKLIGKLSA